MGICILRLREVQRRTGLSRSAIYQRISDRQFPKQIKLGVGRAVGWVDHEIDAWIEGLTQGKPINAKKKG